MRPVHFVDLLQNYLLTKFYVNEIFNGQIQNKIKQNFVHASTNVR